MPLYEYYCPQCQNKFETMKAMWQRHKARCPHCNSESRLAMSRFSFKFFNPFTVDGEGFTSKFMRHEEVAELNQETRER